MIYLFLLNEIEVKLNTSKLQLLRTNLFWSYLYWRWQKVLVMELSEFTQETRAKLNDLLKYWKKWENVKDADVLQLLDSIATGYGGKVVDR